MSNKSTVHNWANQIYKISPVSGVKTELAARDGNIFWKGRVIYSYGHHFPMAVLWENGTVIINQSSYSHSTSKHQSYTRSAINPSTHPKKLYFPTETVKEIIYQMDCYDGHNGTPKSKSKRKAEVDRFILACQKRQAGDFTKSAFSLFSGSKIRWKKYEYYLDYCEKAKEQAALLNKKFTPDKKIITELKPVYVAYLVNKEKAREKAERTRQYNRAHYNEIALKNRIKARLKNGYSLFCDPANSNYYLKEIITLSVNDNQVETSNGNRVTIDTAHALLRIWKKAIMEHKTFSDKEFKAGPYQGVTMRYNGTVKIGCTRILPDEVQKLNNLLRKAAKP